MNRLALVVGAALFVSACGGTGARPVTGNDIVARMSSHDIRGFCQDYRNLLAVGGTFSMAERTFSDGYKPTPNTHPTAREVYVALLSRCKN